MQNRNGRPAARLIPDRSCPRRYDADQLGGEGTAMADDGEPGFATRVRAALRGERSAAALETLRQAGAAVYGELAEAEESRSRLVVDGGDMWTAGTAMSG